MTALKGNLELSYTRSLVFVCVFSKLVRQFLFDGTFQLCPKQRKISNEKKILEILTTVFLDQQVKSWMIRVVDHNLPFYFLKKRIDKLKGRPAWLIPITFTLSSNSS